MCVSVCVCVCACVCVCLCVCDVCVRERERERAAQSSRLPVDWRCVCLRKSSATSLSRSNGNKVQALRIIL